MLLLHAQSAQQGPLCQHNHSDLLSLGVHTTSGLLSCFAPWYCACLQDRTGRTALHWAAESNHVETARTLLDFGIDLKTEECMGRCSSCCAVQDMHQNQRSVKAATQSLCINTSSCTGVHPAMPHMLMVPGDLQQPGCLRAC
jgi:hypothetical protein